MENLDDLVGAAPKTTGQFGKGNPGKPKGAQNKLTAKLKEALEQSLDLLGQDAAGTEAYAQALAEGKSKEEAQAARAAAAPSGTAVDYLRRLGNCEPKAYATLLGRLLPTQLTGEGGGSIQFEAIERRIVPAKAKP